MHPLKVLHIVILLITFGFQCFLPQSYVLIHRKQTYSRHPLSQINIISNFFVGPFILPALLVTALINLFGISNPAILNIHYVELFFFFGPFIFIQGCFPSAISNFFNFIHSDVEIIHSKTLIKCLSSHISTQQHVGQAKPNVKGLGKKCQALKDLERRLSNRAVCYLASRSQLVFNLFSKKIKVSQVFFCCP